MTIPRESLDSWFGAMTRLVSAFTQDFETRFGYPPGDNRVVGATGGGLVTLHDDLADLYSRVGEVSLPDVGSGFFVHPARSVTGPTRLSGFVDDTITVFGSDGGGSLFAPSGSTGRVYRLTGAALIGSTYETTEGGTAVVADGVWGFLNYLLESVRTA